MKKDYPDIQALENEKWQDPDPATGKLGTRVPAKWLQLVEDSSKSLTLEILEVLKEAKIEPNELKNTQLKDAIISIAAARVINWKDVQSAPEILDLLGDSKIDGASQRIVNVVNTLAKNAQTAANLANDKANQAKQEAYEADQKAVAAQNKANQVPNPVKDQFLIGNTATGYKLITKEELITLLAIPSAVKVVNETGDSTTDVMSQKAVKDAVNASVDLPTKYLNREWYTETSNRGIGVVYTNNNEYPIDISVAATDDLKFASQIVIDGIGVARAYKTNSDIPFIITIPSGSTYEYRTKGYLHLWYELK